MYGYSALLLSAKYLYTFIVSYNKIYLWLWTIFTSKNYVECIIFSNYN